MFEYMTDEEKAVIRKILTDDTIKSLAGSEEWSLTEEEENLYWDIVFKLENTK
jgi:hypothetical protein